MINVGANTISNIKIGSTQAKKAYVGTTLIWEKSSVLPSGYTELEYIESTSSGGQYIDLDIMLYDTLNKNYDIAIKFILYGAGQDNFTQPTLFGCQENVNPWPGTFIRNNGSTNSIQARYIGANVKDNSIGNVGDLIELPVQTPPNKNVYNYNNSNQTHTWGTSLFCIFDPDKTPQRFARARLYYFKLFVEGTLVRDMIPAQRNSDNVVGLYDVVNDVFYTSPNGAAFVAST